MTLGKKIYQSLRWACLRAAFGAGLGDFWLRDRPGVRILIYHGVVPPPLRRIHARFVSTTQFDAQLSYLRQRHQIVSLEQVYAGDYDPGRMAIAVTFDDGYRNNLVHALPLLQKHKVSATFFVTAPRAAGQDLLWADALDISTVLLEDPIEIAGRRFHKNRKGVYVDENGRQLKDCCKREGPAFLQATLKVLAAGPLREHPEWLDYWQLLDAAELRTLAEAPGISIGGHGTVHCSLDTLPLEEALQEVEIGREWIEKAIGRPIHTFAFPDGAYNPELVEALTAKGLRQLLLSEFRFGDAGDPRLRERFTIHPFLPTKVLMREMLKGHYF